MTRDTVTRQKTVKNDEKFLHSLCLEVRKYKVRIHTLVRRPRQRRIARNVESSCDPPSHTLFTSRKWILLVSPMLPSATMLRLFR